MRASSHRRLPAVFWASAPVLGLMLATASTVVAAAQESCIAPLNDCTIAGAEKDDAATLRARAMPGSGPESGVLADRRVTTNVQPVGALANGIKIYMFQFTWEDRIRVGPLAQDLEARSDLKHAVITMSNGLLGIDLASLNMRMATEAEWLAHGVEALKSDYFAPETAAQEQLPLLHNKPVPTR